MQISHWSRTFESIAKEFVPFFGLADLLPLLRQAGRRAGATAPEGLGDLPLSSVDGGYVLQDRDAPDALLAWCAGWLEGNDPGQRRVEIERDAPDGPFLQFGSDVPGASHTPDFNMPEHGPLTPFQLAQVADLSQDAVIVVDRELKFRAWNQGATRMFGYTHDEAVGKYYDLLVPDDLRAKGELDHLGKETERWGTVSNIRTRRVTKDGRELQVHLTRTLVRNRGNEIVGFGVILRDVTEDERIKTQLESSRRLAQVGELASQVAHEVRNPLASIHGALQILRRRLKPAPEEDAVFDDLDGEIMRLDRLVTDLLRFGRPTAPETERVDVYAWLTDWIARMHRERGDRPFEIVLTGTAGALVDLDARLFEHVVRNLFENSMEAATADCRFEVNVLANDLEVTIDCADNGPGIPADLREKVLDPFFTTKSRGSGLGLAVCQRHLGAHGGSLELLDTDAGTTFRVRLPRAADRD